MPVFSWMESVTTYDGQYSIGSWTVPEAIGLWILEVLGRPHSTFRMRILSKNKGSYMGPSHTIPALGMDTGLDMILRGMREDTQNPVVSDDVSSMAQSITDNMSILQAKESSSSDEAELKDMEELS